MRKRRTIYGVSALTALTILVVAGWTTANLIPVEPAEPQSLFPANTFLVSRMDAAGMHDRAYQQTAEYKAFYESGLADLVTRTLDFFVERDESGQAAAAREAISDIFGNGWMVGSFLTESEQMPPIPAAVIVFPESGDWVDQAADYLTPQLEQQGLNVQTQTISGRQVTSFIIPDSPGFEVGLWQEGAHMVLVVGRDAINQVIKTASGDTPSLADNERWQAVSSAEVDFAQNSLLWLDWQALQTAYGDISLPIPVEQELTVLDVLKFLKLDKMQQLTSRAGYKGEAIWSEVFIEGFGSSAGPQLTIDDLPPLPVNFNSLSAFQVDLGQFYTQAISMSREVAKLAGPQELEQFEQTVAVLPDLLGFDPQADLLDHLGNTGCVYVDLNNGVFGMGTTFCMSLKNAEGMSDFLSTQMDRLEEAEENGQAPDWMVYPIRIMQDDQELIVFDLYSEDGQAVQMGALQVIDDWLVIGVMPQSLASFQLRLNDDLPSWKPVGEYETALTQMPEKFSSLTIVNTRDSYQMLFNWVTTFLPFMQTAALDGGFLQDDEELPFYVEDFPPAEQIAMPLFPNMSATVSDANGTRIISRASTYGIPLPGGGGESAMVAGTGVGIALLLPAVQQAREAARRASSKNNMKQIGLAMHNFHDTHRAFPAGTVINKDLKPEQRLSWAYSILPYIEQAALYNAIGDDEAWDSTDNDIAVSVEIPVYLDPRTTTTKKNGYPTISYAGMAGVGKDAPNLAVNHERAGVFGYDRVTRFRDITDGTSNTIMISTVNKDLGPWAQGGTSTLRSLTKKPYINGPDGIGSSDGQTTMVLMADGSVRVVSANVDPEVFENLVKIRDGNIIPEF